MTIEQAAQIIDQLISLAQVNRSAHTQGIEALKVLFEAAKKNKEP